MSISTYKVSSKPANESLSGVVERLTYHSSESGYTVVLQKPITIAVNQLKQQQRHTRLQQRLMDNKINIDK